MSVSALHLEVFLGLHDKSYAEQKRGCSAVSENKLADKLYAGGMRDRDSFWGGTEVSYCMTKR